ncbi:hypothetical protein ACQ4PT_028754 [Festuca glaucescens]
MLQTNGPRFPVETGRRDGKVSSCADAENDLAPPNANIVDLKTYFSFKSLSWKDLVVLSGSHTIGRAECAAFAADRLYNNSGKGVQDPTLDKKYARTCGRCASQATRRTKRRRRWTRERLRVRPELLPERVQQQGHLRLRPGAPRRQVDARLRREDGGRGVAARVLRRLRRRHDQHGQDGGAHRRQRGDQENLQRLG